jgi:hypothetical protein
MSDQATKLRRCSRCGTAVESCAFCDEPDCPAITCYRCVSVAFIDRIPPKMIASSRSPG